MKGAGAMEPATAATTIFKPAAVRKPAGADADIFCRRNKLGRTMLESHFSPSHSLGQGHQVFHGPFNRARYHQLPVVPISSTVPGVGWVIRPEGNQVFTMPAASYTAGGVVSNLAGRVFGGGPFLTSQTPARFQHHLPGVTLPKNGDILTRLEIRLR